MKKSYARSCGQWRCFEKRESHSSRFFRSLDRGQKSMANNPVFADIFSDYGRHFSFWKHAHAQTKYPQQGLLNRNQYVVFLDETPERRTMTSQSEI